MTKGPGFGSEGVCSPVKELHTYKAPSYKKEASALERYSTDVRETWEQESNAEEGIERGKSIYVENKKAQGKEDIWLKIKRGICILKK